MLNRLSMTAAALATIVGLSGATAGVMIHHRVTGTGFTLVVLERGMAGRVRLLTSVSSGVSRIGDPVAAELLYPWNVEGQTVLPAGARVEGFVTRSETSGHRNHICVLALRYDRVLLPNGGSMEISSKPIVFQSGGGFDPKPRGGRVDLQRGSGMLLRLLQDATVPVSREVT